MKVKKAERSEQNRQLGVSQVFLYSIKVNGMCNHLEVVWLVSGSVSTKADSQPCLVCLGKAVLKIFPKLSTV